MRAYLSLLLVVVVVLMGGCSAPPAPQPQGPPPPDYRLTGTIKDIMDSVIDPSADFIWESVSTTVSAKGVEEKRPQTDDDWKEVRRRAIAIIEGANMLLVPGRKVAKPGEKAENPALELQPEEIEAAINQDRPAFEKLAHGLQDTLVPVLAAIEKKDADALVDAGGAIDRACETCHLKYWYPKDEAARKIYEESALDAKPAEQKDAAAK